MERFKKIAGLKSRSASSIIILAVTLFVAACQGGPTKEEKRRAEQLMEETHRQRNYQQLLALADSFEQVGNLSQAKACYWRGYAYDRLKQIDKAETSWRQAMELTRNAERGDDAAIYVKSASRLANLLCVNGDYEGTIQLAEPIITRLEEQKRDTTSDYENLLIYVTCCKAAVGGGSEREIEEGFEEAYTRHQEYIKKNRNDTSYKNAIAGLINIAYYCVKFKRYKYALTYTRNFGELLGEYEQREGVSADYIDRQLGRYDIYKAMALQGLGEREEADLTYKAFLETTYSKTSEGQALSEDYLAEAGISASDTATSQAVSY